MLGTDGVRKMSKSVGNTIDILAPPDVIREAGHVDGHRHAADPAHRPGPARRSATSASSTASSATTIEDLGRRANGADGLRRHEAPAGRPDRRPLRPGARALPRAHGEARRRSTRSSPPARSASRPMAADDDGRGPREDGPRDDAPRLACDGLPADAARTPLVRRHPRARRGRARVHRPRLRRRDLRHLRRPDHGLLPGLAARVHARPDREPRDGDPVHEPGRRDLRRLLRALRRARRRLDRGRGGARQLDRRLHRQPAELRANLPSILAPWQARLERPRRSRSTCRRRSTVFLDNISQYAVQLAAPLQQIAVASIGAIGNLLLVVVLSLYMVADRERPRRVRASGSCRATTGPRRRSSRRRSAGRSAASSAGQVDHRRRLRGGLPRRAASSSGSSSSPSRRSPPACYGDPVLRAVRGLGPAGPRGDPVQARRARRRSRIVVAVGWLVVMNWLQPRIMATSLRIHPIVVLGSVLVGLKVAGIPGAIFGIPIAAVISALFLHVLNRGRGTRAGGRARGRARGDAPGPDDPPAARAEPGHRPRRGAHCRQIAPCPTSAGRTVCGRHGCPPFLPYQHPATTSGPQMPEHCQTA